MFFTVLTATAAVIVHSKFTLTQSSLSFADLVVPAVEFNLTFRGHSTLTTFEHRSSISTHVTSVGAVHVKQEVCSPTE